MMCHVGQASSPLTAYWCSEEQQWSGDQDPCSDTCTFLHCNDHIFSFLYVTSRSLTGWLIRNDAKHRYRIQQASIVQVFQIHYWILKWVLIPYMWKKKKKNTQREKWNAVFSVQWNAPAPVSAHWSPFKWMTPCGQTLHLHDFSHIYWSCIPECEPETVIKETPNVEKPWWGKENWNPLFL